jgi:hypothetical protein
MICKRKRMKKAEFTDCQILLAIRSLRKCTTIELLEYCILNYNTFKWDYHIIRNSLRRLDNNGKILIFKKTILIEYKRNNRTLFINRTCKIIYKNVEEYLNDNKFTN